MKCGWSFRHEWTKWKRITVTLVRYDYEVDRQERSCTRCGLTRRREFD